MQAAATAIFRKVSLERLSSPEQLDQVLRVTTPRSWVALAGVGSLLFVALVWGVTGSVATKAGGQGVIVRTGSVLTIVTPGSGQVATLHVGVGDRIKAHQVVAQVAQPALLEKIRVTRELLAETERDGGRTLHIKRQMTGLQLEAMKRQRANSEREIAELEEQVRLVKEQIPIDDELLAKGLITKQQTFTNRKRLLDINGQIASLQARLKQMDAEVFTAEAQVKQTEGELQAHVAEMQRQLDGFEKELAITSNVVTPYAGQVVELKVVQGATIAAGSPILSIQPDSRDLEVVIYLPSEKAKSVTPGLEAQISPSTVKREEFGFMRGKVTYVADFPATPASVNRNFENQSLVQSLLGNGPVTEVRVKLIEDGNSPSGYRWSSRTGPPVTLSSGTICTGLIVTREQKPITLVFPYIKEKLGIG
jgi:HlyD family secretion protein